MLRLRESRLGTRSAACRFQWFGAVGHPQHRPGSLQVAIDAVFLDVEGGELLLSDCLGSGMELLQQSLTLNRLVVDHRVDLGLVMGPVGDARVQVHGLQQAELGRVLPPCHSLLAKPALAAGDLAQDILMSVAAHQPVRGLLQRAPEQAGVTLDLAVGPRNPPLPARWHRQARGLLCWTVSR